MIFVTVGTHEQQFNRLIQCVDDLKKEEKIKGKVIIQTGFSTYVPKYCQHEKLLAYQQMIEYMEEAHIIITHGGPSSIMMALQMGKRPIVVPRQKKYNEHVNDHQLEFVKFLQKQRENITVVENIALLENQINDYELMDFTMCGTIRSNNQKFNEELQKIVNQIFHIEES